MLPVVRMGVTGAASIALRRMLPAMAGHPDIEIGAVASRDPAKASRLAKAYGCRAFTGYAALLADDTVDAVYLPLPAALHGEWVERALDAGKHVLAEKPMTTDPGHTRRLLAKASARRLALLENVMFVHHRRHREVARLLSAGTIGPIRAFRSGFSIPAPPDGDIRYRPELGGGSLLDIGLYPVRAALHFLGDDLTVDGAVLRTAEEREVDTSGAVLLHRPDGAVAQLTFGMEHHYTSYYEILGGAGRITVDRAFSPAADRVTQIQVETGPRSWTIDCPPDDQVLNTLSAFVAAVRGGGAPNAACVAQVDLLDTVRRTACRMPGVPVLSDAVPPRR